MSFISGRRENQGHIIYGFQFHLSEIYNDHHLGNPLQIPIAAKNAFEAVRNYQNTVYILYYQGNINRVEVNKVPFVLKL
jgi:hypothetical protein